MGLRVEPQALRTAADRCAERAAQLDTTADYNGQHSAFDWSNTGLIQVLNGLHNDLAELLQQRLRDGAELMRQSAAGLRQAADAYERTDTAAAAALDATYPLPAPVTRER